MYVYASHSILHASSDESKIFGQGITEYFDGWDEEIILKGCRWFSASKQRGHIVSQVFYVTCSQILYQ